MIAIFLAAQVSLSNPSENPVRLHHLCVRRAVTELVKSGEDASVVADAAMTKCRSEEQAGIQYMVGLQTKHTDDTATINFVKRSTEKVWLKNVRDKAILQALELKSN